MIKSGRHRILAAIALQNPSEAELRRLHEQIRLMSPSAFVELVRDVEDEIGNSLNLTLERSIERSGQSAEYDDVFREIDSIRRRQLGIPVMQFAELLSLSISEIGEGGSAEMPQFEYRRGLQAWIEKLVRKYGEQMVLHAAIRTGKLSGKNVESDWKLR